MENLGKFVTIVSMMIISPLVNGYVFTKYWVWFIVPAFEIQPIRLIEAIGIILLINFVRAERTKNVDSFWKDFTESVIFIFLIAGFALLSGWIVTLFM